MLFAVPEIKLVLPQALYPFLRSEIFVERLAAEDSVLEPLTKAIRAGGKRVRPILCYLAGGLSDISPEKLVDMACIVEWAHTASLLHDDVIDGSATRRGERAAWTELGVPRAILGGDFLLASLVERALEIGTPRAGTEMLSVIKAMVTGEFLQASLIEKKSYTKGELERVYFLKTGVLFQWAMQSPFYARTVENPQLQRAQAEFGRKLALVFQRRDDVLDAPEERGAVNAVLLRASELQGCSPFEPSFSSSCFAQAQEEVTLEVRAELARLEDDLNKLWKLIPKSKQPSPYQSECLEAIFSVVRHLAI